MAQQVTHMRMYDHFVTHIDRYVGEHGEQVGVFALDAFYENYFGMVKKI